MPFLSGASSVPGHRSSLQAPLWQPSLPLLGHCSAASALRACGALRPFPSPPRCHCPLLAPSPARWRGGSCCSPAGPPFPCCGEPGRAVAGLGRACRKDAARGEGACLHPFVERGSPAGGEGGLCQLNVAVEDQQSQGLNPPSGTPVPRAHGEGRQNLSRAPFTGRQHAACPAATAAGWVSTGCSAGQSPPELWLMQPSAQGPLSEVRAFVPSAAAWPCYCSFLSPTGLVLQGAQPLPLQ